jgi:GAF domain-containing protein
MLLEHGSFIGRLIASKSPVHIPDITANEVYSAGEAYLVAVVKAGVRTALFVPMLRNDELVGSFSIGRRRIEHFAENEIELVTDFAAQAAIALEPTKNACRHRCAEGAGVTETVGELTFTTEA